VKNIDLSKGKIADFRVKDAVEFGYDTIVFKLKNNVLSPAEKETCKNILKEAHASSLKIVVEYSADNLAEYNSLVSSLSSSLADLRNFRDFVDGIKLDLSKMSEADAKTAADSFAKIRSAINRENVNGLFGVKSAFYDPQVYKASNVKYVDVISHSDFSALRKTDENSWTDFSLGDASYDKRAMDFNLTAADVQRIIEAGGMVGIDSDVEDGLRAGGNLEMVLDLIKGLSNRINAKAQDTPQGKFDSARANVIKSGAVVKNEQNEKNYYRYLSALLSGDDVEKVIDEISKDASFNEYVLNTAKSYFSKNAADKLLIQKEITGYIHGILENTEISTYENATKKTMNFVKASNREVFSSALVKVKMTLYASSAQDLSMGIKTKDSVPYQAQLNPDLKAVADIRLKEGASDAAKADLARLQELVSSLETLKTAEEYFQKVQEAINILESLTSSDEVENMPIALSQLLSLLALKADLETEATIEKMNDGMNNMAEKMRAILASA
jgi:hypothetical protein